MSEVLVVEPEAFVVVRDGISSVMLHRRDHGEPEHNLPLLATIMHWFRQGKLSGHVGEMAGWILRKGNYSRTEPEVNGSLHGLDSSLYEIADKGDKPTTSDYVYKLNIKTKTIRIIQGTQLIGSFDKFDPPGVNRFLAKIGREAVVVVEPIHQEPSAPSVLTDVVVVPSALEVVPSATESEISTYTLLGGVLENRTQTPANQPNTQSSPIASVD